MQLAQRAHEVFAVLFLDAQHRLLQFDEMFRGTLTQTSVYPLSRRCSLASSACLSMKLGCPSA